MRPRRVPRFSIYPLKLPALQIGKVFSSCYISNIEADPLSILGLPETQLET